MGRRPFSSGPSVPAPAGAVNAFAGEAWPLLSRDMTIPHDKARLLETIVAELATIPSLAAIALGGSHARGTHTPQSDLDIGLYYRERRPFAIADLREVAKKLSVSGAPTVTDFYAWGPFVNGGAWIDNLVCKIDFLYRNLEQLERIVRDARDGIWTHSFDQQPPFGFRSVTILGEIHCCKPLRDPEGVLEKLKSEVVVYPPKLKARIVQDSLWCAEFSFQFANGFAKSGDVPNTVACMTRIFHYLEHTLFALNEVYFLNDKRVMQEIQSFPLVPKNFASRVSAILVHVGETPDALGTSVRQLKSVFDDTTELACNLYQPRFAV
jgi:predicted nucleotidyltransferase